MGFNVFVGSSDTDFPVSAAEYGMREKPPSAIKFFQMLLQLLKCRYVCRCVGCDIPIHDLFVVHQCSAEGVAAGLGNG